MNKVFKQMKKALLVACLNVIVLLTGGCGADAKTVDTDATISFMAIALGDNILEKEHSDEVIRKYEEYTGIHVDWQWIPTETYAEQLNYALMDKANIPM